MRDNSHYRIRPEVREMVLFAPHNLLQDPPFSKLDLILCRNLLIYLQRPVQSHVFDLFYYALRPDGYLFLGSAEATDGVTEHFDTMSKQHRVYRRGNRRLDQVVLPSLPLVPRPYSHLAPAESPSSLVQSEAEQHRLLLEELGLPSLLVDEQYHILHLSETVGRFLQHPAGTLTNDVVRLVRPELQSELRLALMSAFSQYRNVRSPAIPVQFNGAPHPVSMLVRPDAKRNRALVIFWENTDPVWVHPPEEQGTVPTTREGQIEVQLQRAQHQLQSTREEYETSVEELRAANEELQSTNEEYRSTLEELETSKEELQSINEELQSVNQGMKVRVEETAQANSDLQNLFAATEIATLFLDRDLCVKRYTPRAADLFNLMPPDRGRPISHLRSKLQYPQLETEARRVLQNLVPIEHQFPAEDGHWYLVSLRPYRTLEDKIDGIVVTCVDVSANKHAEEALRQSEERFRALVNASSYVVYRMSPDWSEMRALNGQGFLADTQGPSTSWLNEYIFSDDQSQLLATIQEAITTKSMFELEHRVLRVDGSMGWALSRAVPILNEQDEIVEWFGAASDVTARKQAETALREWNEQLEDLVEQRTTQITELVTQLTLMSRRNAGAFLRFCMMISNTVFSTLSYD